MSQNHPRKPSHHVPFSSQHQPVVQDTMLQKEKRIQEIGRELITQLFMYIRALQLYSQDNKIFSRPLLLMESMINEIVNAEGQMKLFGDDATIYINQTLIQLPYSFLPSLKFLLETWAQRGIGGIAIDSYITQEQLRDYLQQFSPYAQQMQTAHFQGAIRSESLQHVRSSIQRAASGEDLSHLLQAKVDPQQYAILLYSRLLQLVSKQWASLSDEDNVLLNQTKRVLQELIDLCSTHKVQFLGFTSETDQQAYESYHICNVVFFSILFGQFLGLKRVYLLELSLSAVFHNVGKRWIPPTLLGKNQDLTPQEQSLIRKIGLFTVRERLKGEFCWEKLYQALTIAGVYAAPQPFHERQGEKTQGLANPRYNATIQIGSLHTKGPHLFSHMIRLASTFDALCTRRPYRFKLFPAEALMKMKMHLYNQFDPYLLQRFIAFFSPMALHKQNNPQGQINPPPERKSTRAYGEALSPFGYGIQKQREQYWQLRRLTNPTEKEQRTMQLLREWIDRRSDVLGHLRETQHSTQQRQRGGGANLTFSSIRAIQNSPNRSMQNMPDTPVARQLPQRQRRQAASPTAVLPLLGGGSLPMEPVQVVSSEQRVLEKRTPAVGFRAPMQPRRAPTIIEKEPSRRRGIRTPLPRDYQKK